MSKEKQSKHYLAKIILTLVGVVLMWGLVVPAFEFPDEQAHLGTVSYLATEGHLPGYHVPDMTIEMTRVQELLGVLRNPQGQNSYTYHPEYHPDYTDSLVGKFESEIQSLNTVENRTTYTTVEEAARYPVIYYAFSSVFWRIAGSGDLLTRLFAVRLGSLLIAALMAYVSYLTGMLIFSKKKLALTLTTLVILQPMMSFVTAGINSDNLHNLLFMLAIYLGLLVIKSGISAKLVLSLALTIGLDLYTKPQGFIMIPIVATALLISVLRHKKYRQLTWLALLAVLITLLGWEQILKYQGFLNISNADGASFVEYLRFSANKLLAQNVVWYWGVFKWLGVVLPPTYWRVANRVVLLSVLGLVVYVWRVIKRSKKIIDPYVVSYLLLTSLIYAAVIFWFDWQYVKGWGFSLGIQARYFFPTILAHMSILLIGLRSLGWNKRSTLWITRLVFFLFLWLQLGGLWHLISIYYDTSSISTLITQLSQYKPFYAKGNWWYLWSTIYLASISSLTCLIFKKK